MLKERWLEMERWPEPQDNLADIVSSEHRKQWSAPDGVACAPATSVLMGEFTDFTGGMSAVMVHSLEAAVAFSYRTDREVHVRFLQTGSEEDISSADADELEKAAGTILDPPVHEDDSPAEWNVSSSLPTDEWAVRLGGVVITMIHRQLLTRDTPGVNVTVVCDIPPHAGLGRTAAVTSALAFALNGEPDERDDAPTRAKLASVAHCAAEVFTGLMHPRARFVGCLRGTGEGLNLVDFGDGSLTVAPAIQDAMVITPALTRLPEARDNSDRLAWRRTFVSQALKNFGVTTLQQLPDAPARVGDWLRTVISVKGSEGLPTVGAAVGWLTYLGEEATRAHEFAGLLRSRRMDDAFEVFARSAGPLREFALDEAAAAAPTDIPARPAAIGRSTAMLCLTGYNDLPDVPGAHVIVLRPGTRAH